MNNKIEILQELQQISPVLSSFNKMNVYKVPDNYFNNLSDLILSKIKSSEKNQDNELSEIAPTLNSITKQNVYKIPSNYFETFKVDIPAEKPVAKIVKLRRINTFAKYAVAAVAIGIIFTGGFLYKYNNNHHTVATVNIANAVKNINDAALADYADDNAIQFNDDSMLMDEDLNVAEELKTVSNAELNQYYNSEHLKYAAQ